MARTKHVASPRTKFQQMALKMAKQHLENAIQWIDKKDCTWARVEISAALRLVEAAQSEGV